MNKQTILLVSAFAVLALLAGSASAADVGAERTDQLDLSNSLEPEDCTGEPCWQQDLSSSVVGPEDCTGEPCWQQDLSSSIVEPEDCTGEPCWQQ